MDFDIALCIAIILAAIGAVSIILVKPFIKSKTNKKLPLHICNIVCFIGLFVYISYLISISNGEHLNSVITFKEYPIEKITLNHVYFSGRGGDSFGEEYVILEEPDDKCQNIVIAEIENYEIRWLFCKIKTFNSKYHVYLTDDMYKRIKDGNVIYENRNNH